MFTCGRHLGNQSWLAERRATWNLPWADVAGRKHWAHKRSTQHNRLASASTAYALKRWRIIQPNFKTYTTNPFSLMDVLIFSSRNILTKSYRTSVKGLRERERATGSQCRNTASYFGETGSVPADIVMLWPPNRSVCVARNGTCCVATLKRRCVLYSLKISPLW